MLRKSFESDVSLYPIHTYNLYIITYKVEVGNWGLG
jgi:hypothetical protein